MSRGSRLAVLVAVSIGILGLAHAQAAVIQVPADYPTIQAALDAAVTGDIVLVAPGSYAGGLLIAGKSITLASEFLVTGDAATVSATIVTGGDPMILIDATAVDTTVQGLSFKTGGKGLETHASRMNILNNRFIDTSDAVSFESAGGLVRGNYFDDAGDDGIDADHPDFDLTIENNLIFASGDDGIEIRLHGYTGPTAQIVIRNNYITGSDEDGIQLIDYAGLSSRAFRIERNVIVGNALVGLGCMADGNTIENLAGAPMVEPVQVVNNTFSGNPNAITSSDNMLVLNNIIANSTQVGLKRASASSWAGFNDFWHNGTDYSNANVDVATRVFQNPLFAPNYSLQPGSLCIDAGAASVLWNGSPVAAPSFDGAAPDLGGKETPAPAPANVLSVGAGGAFADIQSALDAAVAPFTIVRVAPGSYPAFTIGATAPFGLRVTGDGTGTVTIDTSLQAVTVYGLPLAGAIELADLSIGSSSSGGVGLAVTSCAGLVLIDQLVVHGGPGKPGLQIAASAHAAIQRSELDGTPGLRLSSAANAVASRGTLDEFELAGNSVLTTCQLAASGTVGPGSAHTALGGPMPSVSMPGFVHRHTPFAVTLEGAPSQPLYLCVSIQLGYAQWASPPFEMALIAKLANGLVIPLGPLPASGSLVLSASLPSDETLLGVPLVVQVVTQDTAAGTYRFGHAATLIGMP